MCRTAFILITLVAFAAAGASDAQVSAARTHRKTAAAASSHATHTRASAKVAPRAKSPVKPVSKSTAKSPTSIANRRTPEQVGRAAGNAIRRQLALRRASQRRRTTRGGRARLEHAALRERITRPEAAVREPKPSAEADADEASPRLPSAADTDDSMPARENGAPTDAASRTAAAKRSAKGTSERDATEEASLGMLRGGMPAPLRGSLASLQRQNERLDAEGLERIEDEDDLAARIAARLLVPVPVSAALTINGDLAESHRYCRPWTARFLTDLAKAHEAVFHRPLLVSSAVRTVDYQKRLMQVNGNAAAAEGDVVSPHLTGATIDIAKSGLSRQEIAWMRRRLQALQAANKIDVEEEFQQACFHITVYKTYVPARTAHPAKPADPGTQRPARPQAAETGSEAEGA